jgi:hypothetical protein
MEKKEGAVRPETAPPVQLTGTELTADHGQPSSAICPFCGNDLQDPPKPVDHQLWCRDNHLAAARGGAA